jgi:hypothetical protein
VRGIQMLIKSRSRPDGTTEPPSTAAAPASRPPAISQ